MKIFCEAALKQRFSNKFDLTWHVFLMYHEKLCCQMSNSGQSLDIFPSTVKKNARQILVPYVHVYHLRKKAPKKSSSFLYESWKWLRFVSFGHAKPWQTGRVESRETVITGVMMSVEMSRGKTLGNQQWLEPTWLPCSFVSLNDLFDLSQTTF